jgi:hypothetical protein
MPDFNKLDQQFRLQPWLYPAHRGFVSSRYGSLLATPKAAEAYLKEYEDKEKAFDAAYERQRELLRTACIGKDQAPQELPDPEKISWDVRSQFGVSVHAETSETTEEEKEPSGEVPMPKKRGRKPKIR